MARNRIRPLIILLCLLGIACAPMLGEADAYAQSEAGTSDSGFDCGALVENLKQAIRACRILNENDACYGNPAASAAPTQYRFFRPADRRPIPDLEAITVDDETGVVVLHLVAAGEGAPIQALLMGPNQLDGGAASIFNYRTLGRGDFLCTATPPGLMLRTESGKSGAIRLNDVQIELGSVAFITGDADDRWRIVNFDGRVTVGADGARPQTIPPGYEVTIQPAVDGLPTIGTPAPSELIASDALNWLAFQPDGLQSVTDVNETVLGCGGGLAFGETVTDTIYSPGQECLYRFCAGAGDTVTINMTANGASLDPWLDLRGPDSSLVRFNDDLTLTDTNSLICNQPLPVDGCYTIVARPFQNESRGEFSISLERFDSCSTPEPRCRVVSRSGLILRSGPDISEAALATLVESMRLQPIALNEDGRWLEVIVADSGEQGWVRRTSELVECEVEPPTVTPTSTSVNTTTPSPTEQPKKTPRPTKEGPFEAP